jgi:spore maturation protein CgeB
MNILLIGKFTEDQFAFHIADTLTDMGHSVLKFDPSQKYKYSKTIIGRRIHQLNHLVHGSLINFQIIRNLRIRKLERILKLNSIELTISTHDFLYPDEIEFIKNKTKAPVVLWFPDAVGSFNKGLMFISNYDYMFFKDPYIISTISNQYNLKSVYYLPECCNPKFHKSVHISDRDDIKYGCDISTYGNPHNLRSLFFSNFFNTNYSIKIWGHLPPIWLKDKRIKALYTGTYVFNESKAKAVLATKINLNTLSASEILSLNARAFEIAGIGGFQIIHRRPGLEEFFKENSEIVAFNNFDELIKKVDYYLGNEKERKEIAENGQVRAYNEHTYMLRLKVMIETIDGKANGYPMPRR